MKKYNNPLREVGCGFVSFLLILSTFHSEAKALDLIGFCENPYKMICGDSGAAAEARKKRIALVESTMKTAALETTLKEIGVPKAEWSSYSEDSLYDLKPSRLRKKALKVFYNQLRDLLREYLKANKVSQDQLAQKVKSVLKKVIRESAEITNDRKETFQSYVADTRFITIAEVGSELENTNRDITLLMRGCAQGNFVDNAFADQTKREGRIIVLCPGMLVDSIEYAKEVGLSKENFLLPMVATLGHEFSHQFDYRDFPNSYEFLEKELQVYANELASRKLPKYMSEISADYWGNLVLKQILEEVPNRFEQEKILQGATDDLCSTEDDGEHPTGEFRLDRVAALAFCK